MSHDMYGCPRIHIHTCIPVRLLEYYVKTSKLALSRYMRNEVINWQWAITHC